MKMKTLRKQQKNESTRAEQRAKKKERRDARRAGERLAEEGMRRVDPIFGRKDQSDPGWADKSVRA